MLGSMATVPLPASDDAQTQPRPLQQTLFDQYRIEVPVFHWPHCGQPMIRISAHLYNRPEDYRRLANVLREQLPHGG
jgi:isopenicillin-N epimerase